MKTLLLSAFAFGVFSLASCAKDYTCTCTSNTGYSSSVTYHAKKKDAEAACNTSASSGGVTYTCSIK
jgi:hypothetical protein